MPYFLKRASRFRAHAAASLANAEAASDVATLRAHLAMARHFYALAEQEISQREAKRMDRPGHFRALSPAPN
jgi:hypothetical protein